MPTMNLGRVRQVPKGEWNAATAYTFLDVVSYVGASYLAVRPTVPAATPLTDETYWLPLSEPGVYAFADRATAVADCADGWVPEDGALYWLGGLQYRGQTGATMLPGLPGLRPEGRVASSAQWGLDPFSGADQTAVLRDMFEWCAENAMALEVEPGVYGFTNFGVVVPFGRFDISAPRGNAILRQLAGRDGDAMAIQFGGQNIDTTTLAASAAAGDHSVTLTAAGQVQPGDTLRLRLSRVLEGDHRFDPDRSYMQLCRVTSKAGSVVRLADPLVFDFPVGIIATGTAQAGSAGTITLAAGSAFDEPAVKGYLLRITAGTGAGQERFIDTYDPATKVVGIGTASSFTGVNQAAFSPAPDATSVYQIVAEVDIEVDRPATGKIRDLIFEGYSPSGEIVKGLHLARWDGGLFDGLRISDFSSHGAYTTRCYKSTVQRCRFERANYAEAGGAGLGYGHNDQAGFMNTVTGCHAVGCRTGFDNGTTTLFLSRHGNTVTGGGLTYDGQPFWPAVGGVENSGLSTHGGSYGGTDRDNTTYDVRSCKIRATQYRAQGNRHFGQMGDDGVYKVYYSGSVEIVDCEYSDLFSTMPTARSNSTLNEGGKNTPGYPLAYQRPRAFVVVRHQTMAKNSLLTLARNTARSVLQSMVFLDEETTAENLALHVIGNRFSVVSEGANVLSVVKATNGLGAGTIGLRQFWAWGNDFSVGGTTIGTVLTDNHNPYPILSSLVSLTDVRLTADAVGHYRALTRAQLVGMATGPWQVGAVITADGREYRFTGTTPEIPDMPGWVPSGTPTFLHYGAAGDDLTDDTAACNAALAAHPDEMIDGLGLTYAIHGTLIGKKLRNAKLRKVGDGSLMRAWGSIGSPISPSAGFNKGDERVLSGTAFAQLSVGDWFAVIAENGPYTIGSSGGKSGEFVQVKSKSGTNEINLTRPLRWEYTVDEKIVLVNWLRGVHLQDVEIQMDKSISLTAGASGLYDQDFFAVDARYCMEPLFERVRIHGLKLAAFHITGCVGHRVTNCWLYDGESDPTTGVGVGAAYGINESGMNHGGIIAGNTMYNLRTGYTTTATPTRIWGYGVPVSTLITGNNSFDNKQSGMSTHEAGGGQAFVGNKISGCLSMGMNIRSKGAHVIGNSITDTPGPGISIINDGVDTYAENAVIQGNIFENTNFGFDQGGVDQRGQGCIDDRSPSSTITNNFIRTCGGPGIQSEYGVHTIITGNTIINPCRASAVHGLVYAIGGEVAASGSPLMVLSNNYASSDNSLCSVFFKKPSGLRVIGDNNTLSGIAARYTGANGETISVGFANRPNFGPRDQSLAIVSGVLNIDDITLRGSIIAVSAESGTSDDLNTISGGIDGDEILLRSISGHTITVVNGAGYSSDNIRTGTGTNRTMTYSAGAEKLHRFVRFDGLWVSVN